MDISERISLEKFCSLAEDHGVTTHVHITSWSLQSHLINKNNCSYAEYSSTLILKVEWECGIVFETQP